MRGTLLTALAAVLFAAACAAPAGSSASPAAAPIVKVADSSLGKILVDMNGRTLYTWRADTAGSSTCYDQCAQAWPPLLADTATVTGDGVRATLGTSARRDGARQVTHDNMPLYYFAPDTAAGDVKGQGSMGFGALWEVIVNP